jgi:putative membrane protein
MHYLVTFLKGVAMGAADVVPGVSGGTIAFITGIYDTLLESIRRINPRLIGLWQREGFSGVFRHINGTFLICLFTGIVTSILSLAKLISWLLVNHPIPVWAFFFGLILISIVHILKQVQQKALYLWLFVLAGCAFAYSITMISPLHMAPTTINFVLAGAIAICAMILPGISGSFILLLLGMYAPILAAAKSLQIDVLLLFVLGCIIGLLTFSHLLSWLLKHHRDSTLMFLTGLMAGTLPKIWPWKETLTWRTNSHGESVPLLQHNLSPFEFESIVGQPHQLFIAIVMMLVAIALVFMLEKLADQK